MGLIAFLSDKAASSDEQLSERTGCFDDGDINWGGGEGGGGGGRDGGGGALGGAGGDGGGGDVGGGPRGVYMVWQSKPRTTTL